MANATLHEVVIARPKGQVHPAYVRVTHLDQCGRHDGDDRLRMGGSTTPRRCSHSSFPRASRSARFVHFFTMAAIVVFLAALIVPKSLCAMIRGR
jgi:hypothetical protein